MVSRNAKFVPETKKSFHHHGSDGKTFKFFYNHI
jgi:hypothetical protein